MTKGHLGIGFVIALGIAILLYATALDVRNRGTDQAVVGATLPGYQRYQSVDAGVSFTHPEKYMVSARKDSYRNNTIDVLVLTDKNAIVPDMSEGPVSISIIKIPDVIEPLPEWVQNNSITNFYLSPDKKLVETEVAGEPAVGYRFSGLYENDGVAVKHGTDVYLFFGSWLAADDSIRTDFAKLLTSVTFN